MLFQGIIFDLDGTLLNTLHDLGSSANAVLHRHGFPEHEISEYRYFIGKGFANLIARALPETARSEQNISQCLAEFQEEYSRNWRKNSFCYDGIPELLTSLAQRNIKMGILSNKQHEFTEKFVQEFLPDHHFSAVFGRREQVPPKPDPAAALEIARIFSLSPAEILFAGDSAVDMQTAVAAGMYPIGVSWGYRSPEELMQNGCRKLIHHPSELLCLFDL
ncbi:MAG: HAD family hydrolase [Desulfobacterales bacterium]